MTPERITELVDSVRIFWEDGFVVDGQRTDASIERAIRQAVNEALEEAAVSAEKGTNPLGIVTVADAIRTLKLPEE